MSSSSFCCPICNGGEGERFNSEDKVCKRSEIQQRFFKLFERYLRRSDLNRGGEGKDAESPQVGPPLALKELAEFGMISCSGCSKLMESFSQLYTQLEVIQLKLKWKVELLKGIMERNVEVMPIRTYFEKCMEGLEMDENSEKCAEEIIESVVKLKKWMIGKCKSSPTEVLFCKILNTNLPYWY